MSNVSKSPQTIRHPDQLMRSGYCEANGITFHYHRTGGDKPPVVLLHGLTGNGACWQPVAQILKNDYDLIMPDARGHGQTRVPSGAPHEGYRYTDHAADVIGLIAALGLTAPILMGHSMGGLVAALVASRLGSAIRGLVLIDPSFLSPARQREVQESNVAELHRQAMNGGREDVLRQMCLRHPQRSPALLEILTDARLATQLEAFEVLTPPNPDYRDIISQVRVPTLLVTAGKGIVSQEQAQDLRGINQHLRAENIPDAGHGVPFDKPAALAGLMDVFLRDVFHPSVPVL